jgi:hypothetical protein
MNKIKITLLAISISFIQLLHAEELDMSDLGNRFAECSTKSLLLGVVLKSDEEYSKGLLERASEWRVISVMSFMAEGMTQDNAVDAYKKMSGITATNSGIKEVANDKPELIKRSEKLIYDINENCMPYDEHVEQMKNQTY